MKHWDHLTIAERQERLGDANIDRVLQTSQREVDLIDRLQRGLWLSHSDKAAARKALRIQQGKKLK